jgi:RNA polymerase sigma-70 factor (ECF subfamily)
MSKDEDEELLVVLVQHGHIAAFEKLLMRMHKPLRGYVTKMVGESMAEDILQEISLRIYQQIRFLREPKAFQAWAYRIATRIALVHLKREKRWRKLETDSDVINAISTITSSNHDELESELLSMVDRVSPASRAVLLLHYQQHLSLEETAAILDIPLGTAKSRLSYGVATLRDFLKEKEKR